MNMNVTVSIPQLAILDPGKARTVLQQEVAKGVSRVVESIAAAARLRAPVDRGILRASIAAQVTPQQGPVLVQGTVRTGNQAPYAADVEYGTAPHWIQDIDSLKGWARRVLGDERAAYAVRHAIARRGTKAQPFMAPALEQMRPQIPVIMQAAAAIATQRLEQP